MEPIIAFLKVKPSFHRTHTQAFRVPQHIQIKGNRLQIPKFTEGIKFICHRPLEYSKICNATISRDVCGNYFVAIAVEKEIQELLKTNLAVGIDVGIKTLAVCSNGLNIQNPKNTNKYSQKLKYTQRKLSKKLDKAKTEQVFDKENKPVFTKTGKLKFTLVLSKNANKLKISKLHTHISNKRKDHIHKATKSIVENNDISIEDLNTKGILRNRKLSKAVSDASFGEIKRQLEYKSKWYGKQVIKISRWFPSSKTCSNPECSWIKQNLKLSDRVFNCSQCALTLDRDLNASINILTQGLNLGNINFKLNQ